MNDHTQDIDTPKTDDAPSVQQALNELQQLIDEGLPALTREYAPPALLDTWHAMHAEVQRLREMFSSPDLLSGKTVVALGGSFSAGKSSLVNALLGTRLMPTDVTPTTAVPAYAMHGQASRIQALDAAGAPHDLSEAQLKNFTHESGGAQGIRTFYVQRPDFPWQNIALLDTPGYSGNSTDASTARSALNSAQAILWCVPADAGAITATDLKLLASLDKSIPLAIAITKTDKKPPEDLEAIVTQIEETMKKEKFVVQNFFLLNARKESTLEPLKKWLTQFNTPNKRGSSLGKNIYGLALAVYEQMYEHMDHKTLLEHSLYTLPDYMKAIKPAVQMEKKDLICLMRRIKDQSDSFILHFPAVLDRIAQAADTEQGNDSPLMHKMAQSVQSSIGTAQQREALRQFLQGIDEDCHAFETIQQTINFMDQVEKIQKSYAACCKKLGDSQFDFGKTIQLSREAQPANPIKKKETNHEARKNEANKALLWMFQQEN